MRTTIGIPTYNGFFRLNLLLSSIFNYTTEEELKNIRIVVVDDGTPDREEEKRILGVCRKHNVMSLRHPQNRGISASWNTATRYYSNAELIILLNDDIQICHPAWLKCLKYFFENNENIGHVSFSTFNLDPRTALPRPEQCIPDISANPWMSWTPGGQAFAFKKTIFDETEAGFPEKLLSFYEEGWFGYELAFKGYLSYILSFPIVQHWGSQTFGLNHELAFTTPIPELPMEKYRELLKPKFSDEKIEPQPGKVYRMEYSRVLFALKWGCKDYWDAPQNEIEERLRDKIEKRSIKWLDMDGNERQDLI